MMRMGFIKICLLLAALCLPALALSADVEYINTDNHAMAEKPFSDAVRVGNILYLSGVLGIKPGESSLVKGGVGAETRQVMDNIKGLLNTVNLSMDDVVKCTVMLADIQDYAAMNSIYTSYFSRKKPARSTFAATGLALGARIEVECWAAVD
jgi:reactive intermediate/imine deaminase